jgi:uncharacterized protein (TIGR00730 family)
MNICVFCGSSTGTEPIYQEAARELGSLLGSSQHTLVYGGGNVGLMGIVADATLVAGGKVIGVIPEFLQRREVAHNGLTELEVVDTMHQRKQRMAELADAFIAMPGGWGTLDELAEILTWRQLGLIQSSIGILNTNSFFDHLLAQMNLMTRYGFLGSGSLEVLKVEQQPRQLLTQLGAFSVQAS